MAYGEFRRSYEDDIKDHRIIFYGLCHIVENHLLRRWTFSDIEIAERFFTTHNINHTQFPFPRELFMKIVNECNGYFPVKVEGLPEGTVIYPHTPVYVLTVHDEYSALITYLETLLTMVWVSEIEWI